MPVYYQQPQDDFIARFLASMQERAAAQRAMERERASQKELIDYRGQVDFETFKKQLETELALKRAEEERKAAQEGAAERLRVSRDTDLGMGLARENQLAPNGAVQALMDLLGVSGEAAPVEAETAVPNREKAFAQMAAHYPEMPAARLDTLKSAIMQTGDEERRASLVGSSLEPSWEQSEIKLPESKATIDEKKANTAQGYASAESSRATAAKTRQDTKFDAEDRPFNVIENVRKLAADSLKAAASNGLDKDNYERLKGILDKANPDVEKPVHAIQASEAILGAMKSGDGPAVRSGIIVFMKALDDSIAREGEVAGMVEAMGGIEKIKNGLNQFASGKASPGFQKQIEDLNRVVIEKNRRYLNNVLSRYDVQVKAAGPQVQQYYDNWRKSLTGDTYIEMD